ncbi:MAG: FtsW/RodA/SpoVE family cell cycle protein, partial [Alphaproteobacteria bacterium]|nr:FtsW/RodA/SpoVE family cell cycle protein [Alphaproteobacteria bacterium]
MSMLARTDTSIVGRWWWTVDRWMLLALGLLIAAGALLALAASPAVAERIGFDSFYFARRQLMFLGPAVAAMLAISMLSATMIRRFAVVGLVVAIGLLAATLFVGTEVKGASRWLVLGAFSLQPSEFVKPFLVVVTAWMLSAQKEQAAIPGNLIAGAVTALVLALLVAQPDFGMAIMVSLVWCAQVFMAGLPLFWVGVLALVGGLAVTVAYLTVPHVASRIDRFMDPSIGDTFQ